MHKNINSTRNKKFWLSIMLPLLCFLLWGCGGEEPTQTPAPAAEKTVSSFFDDLKAGKFEEAMALTSMDSLTANITPAELGYLKIICQYYFNDMEVRITASQASGDKATVEAQLVVPDVNSVVQSLNTAINSTVTLSQIASESRESLLSVVAQLLPSILANEDIPKQQNTYTFTLKGKNEAWKISEMNNFILYFTQPLGKISKSASQK